MLITSASEISNEDVFNDNNLWTVYILKLSNNFYYTGITNNLERRMKTHISGKGSKYVRAHLPCHVVYEEPAADRSAASKREFKIKKLSRKQKEQLIKESKK